MNIAEVRAGLQSAIQSLTANVYDYVPDSPSMPAIVINIDGVGEYAEIMGGYTPSLVTFAVTALVTGGNETAQRTLDAWLGDGPTTSIPGLILDATTNTISGSVEGMSLRSPGIYAMDVGGARCLAATFEVRIRV